MFDKNIARENVIELLGIFRGSFCVYGTALGAVREGDILAHDLDTDIGIRSEDFRFDMLTEAVRRGWAIRQIFGMRHYGMEIALMRHGVKTDLMFFYAKGHKFYNCLWDNGEKNGIKDEIRHEYPESVMTVIDGKLGKSEIPTLGPDYLTHVYGDWKTPVEKWDWRTDHKCRV